MASLGRTVRRFAFETTHEPPLWVSRFLRPPDAPLIERNWPGLFAEWTGDRSPYEYGVNGDTGEESAFYLSLAWRMTDGLSRHAIPSYYWEKAQAVTGKIGSRVRWEYDGDPNNDGGTNERMSLRRRLRTIAGIRDVEDRGFVPARSPWTLDQMREMSNAERGRVLTTTSVASRINRVGALFTVDDFHDLAALLGVGMADHSAEVNLFGLAPDRGSSLIEALNGNSRPSLDAVLEPGDVFVDVSVGIDIGTVDSMIIASIDDHRGRLWALAEDLERGMATYQVTVPQIQTMDQFLAALGEAIGIYPPRSITMRVGDGEDGQVQPVDDLGNMRVGPKR